MIKTRPIPPKTALVADTGAVGQSNDCIFNQQGLALFADYWMAPWVIFEGDPLTQAYGFAATGTFTANIYIDGESTPSFIVTESDSTPVALETGKTGALSSTASIITCKIVSCSTDLDGLHIRIIP